jgi:DEAD/DEAH box helicase domain-containing protein
MSEQLGLFGEPENQEPAKTTQQEPIKPAKLDTGPRVQYFDLETQKSADDVGGWGNIHKMGLAVGVVWDSQDQDYFVYEEKDAKKLVDKLRTADLVVGFNVIGFDYTVLQPYSDFDLQEINTFDMLVDVKKLLNFRLSLNHLAQHTLNAKKSADGLISLQWYKEGKIDKIIHYCKQDVEITRDLYLYGEQHGYVNYQSRSGNPLQLEVDWKTANFTT